MLNKAKVSIEKIYNEIKTPTLIPILVVVCCYLSLAPMKTDAGFLVCLVLYLLSYVSSKYFGRTLKYALNLFDNWWKRLLAFVIYVYFNISLYGLVYLENNGMDGFMFGRNLYPLIAVIWVTPIYFGMICAVAKILNAQCKDSKGLTFKVKIAAFVVLMLHYALWLYAFNPCISSPDSCGLFNQAHQMLTNPMVNWHPPFYAIVLSFLVKICDSATFLIIVQCVAFSVLIVRMIDYLLRVGCKPIICVCLYLFWGFLFNNVIQMVTLWKDIPYMISITWLTYLLAQFIMERCDVKKSWYFRFVIAMVFTALFRQNGILPVAAVALTITIIMIIKKKYVSLFAVVTAIIIIMIIQGPLYSFYKVESRPGLKFFALANDIVGTYYTVDNTSDDVIKMVNEITENDPDNFPFYSYYTKYNSMALGDYSVSEFLSIYINTFLEHPKAMTIQFMRRNSVLWSIVRPNEEIAGGVNYKAEYHGENIKYEYPYRVPNLFTEKLSVLADKLTNNSLVFVFAWRTGIYTLLLLVVLLLLFCRKKVETILIFIPAIFNALALYIASGWTDYRYFWPISIMAMFIMPFINCYLNRMKE